jgi:hypothetical protein
VNTTVAPVNFDLQAAWLRRFNSDAQSNLRAFALLLQEALPGLVTIQESRSLFSRTAKTIGVAVELGDSRYILQITQGRLQANIAMVVRGITLNTRSVDPADWFARLWEATQKASEHARTFSQSLDRFMAG